MRIAILSDIHANLEALEAVLAHLGKQHCDRIICLGDIVGYGPNPSECLRLLSDTGVACIKGNHDEACASDGFPYRMNAMASAAVVWTQSQLSTMEKLWLSNLPYSIEDEVARFVHSSPCNPGNWNYVVDVYDAGNAFSCFTEKICFVGHTHEAIGWVETEYKVDSELFDRLHLMPPWRYLINVGSVGQPRDRDPRAAYVVYDSERAVIDLHRVVYDIETTQNKIVAAGLPALLAQRLAVGR